MVDGAMYRSLHPVQFFDDQTEGPLGSMGHAERQVFAPRPLSKWWCQKGPVDNCCCCFPLRTGIMLLSLDNLLTGVAKLFTGSIAAGNISRLNLTYVKTCSEGGDSEECKMLLQKEAEAELILSYASLLNVVGIALIIFSVIGLRTAYTGNPKLDNLYMLAFPFLMAFEVLIMVLKRVMAPSTITGEMLIAFCVDMILTIYYCKVTWSFYHRRKAVEDVQLAADASSQGYTINLPLTQAPTVV